MARELAEFAHLAAQDGHHAIAQMMQQMSRHRRVKGMELRGNLAALKAGDKAETEGGE